MIEVRTLTGEELDAAKLAASRWLRSAPARLQVANAVDASAEIAGTLYLGVFVEGKFTVLVRYSPLAEGCYEIHLDAARGTDAELAGFAATQGADALLADGARLVFGWVLRQNRQVRRMFEAGGARWDGGRRLKGKHRGRLLEWLRYCKWNDHVEA